MCPAGPGILKVKPSPADWQLWVGRARMRQWTEGMSERILSISAFIPHTSQPPLPVAGSAAEPDCLQPALRYRRGRTWPPLAPLSQALRDTDDWINPQPPDGGPHGDLSGMRLHPKAPKLLNSHASGIKAPRNSGSWPGLQRLPLQPKMNV